MHISSVLLLLVYHAITHCIAISIPFPFSASVIHLTHQAYDFSPSLHFRNSTSTLTFINLAHTIASSYIQTSDNSLLQFSHFSILVNGNLMHPCFFCTSALRINDLRIRIDSSDSIIHNSLVYTSADSFVHYHDLHMNSLSLDYQGSLLTSGYTRSQSVSESTFRNITHSTDARSASNSKSDICIISNCLIQEGDPGIYGGIVTGLIPYTHVSFACLNSTFTHCMRYHNPSSFSLNDQIIESTEFTSRQEYDDIPSSFLFRNCLFQDMYVDSGTA